MIWVYAISINFITFLVYGADKRRAKKGLWRIPEKTLLLLALVGGSMGGILGMYVFHHKTQKLKFKIGIPCIILLQAGVIGWAVMKLG